MKKFEEMSFEEMSFEEKKEIVSLFSCWLKGYTKEVIMKVMEIQEEIINNDFSMNLMRELKKREEEEAESFNRSIESLFSNFEVFKEYDPHNNPLTHSQSYRDILYDMYIRRQKAIPTGGGQSPRQFKNFLKNSLLFKVMRV